MQKGKILHFFDRISMTLLRRNNMVSFNEGFTALLQ